VSLADRAIRRLPSHLQAAWPSVFNIANPMTHGPSLPQSQPAVSRFMSSGNF